MRPASLLDAIPSRLPVELTTVLLEEADLRIERIVSHGHASPADSWYDQDRGEWVLVLEGAARLEIEGQPELLQLHRGSYVNLPAHQRHRVAWTDPDRPTIWLAIHYGPPA